MNDVIKSLCQALQEEAEAVKGYTDKISSTPENEATKGALTTFAINRLDAVEHIQNLTLQLTKLMSNGISTETGGEDNEQ